MKNSVTVYNRSFPVNNKGKILFLCIKKTINSIEEFFSLEFDYVITLCGENAKTVCPVFTGKANLRLNWNFDDPAEAKGKEEKVIGVFRRVRDEIKAKLDEFVKLLINNENCQY